MGIRREIRPLFGSLWIAFISYCGVVIASQDSFFYMNYLTSFNDECALRLNRSYAPFMTSSYPSYSQFEMAPYQSSQLGNVVPITLNNVDLPTDVCIRYDDVNIALAKAMKKLGYIKPITDAFGIDVNEIDRSAELVLETTKILAERFHLSFKEINEALPTIDTAKTDIWDICPAHYKPRPCTMSRFRSMDGHCNNMKHSVWGSSNTPFVRFLPPVYSNGVDSPKVSCFDGGSLPNPRKVSTTIHRDFNNPSDTRSVLMMSWGQFLDHDMTLASSVRDENDLEISCCKIPPERRHKYCMPFEVPQDDIFYSKHGVRCLDFLRTMAGHRPGCALGPRVNINLLTSAIDANFVYGSTEELAQKLRLGSNGLLKTWDKFHHLGLKDLLPPLIQSPEKDCTGRPRHLFCFLAGDERVNEQIHLTVLHTLYLREHNRIAKQLAFVNPHWNDERLYQETRHIVAASVQHIAFNEFLPLLLGPQYLSKYNLTLQKDGYWYGYDEDMHMGPATAFQTAAFRFGHTHIQGRVRMYNMNHEFIDSIELRELLRKPFIIYEPGTLDKLIGGLLNTPAQVYDPFVTSEVTNHLFQNPMEHFGMDLVALNLMRGRDHGLPGYNDFRKWCGMSRIQTFEELEFYMSNGTAFKYSRLYKHPDDIDLWSAGVSERIMEGAMIGPTFACIIANQFSVLRKGDRFWYENPGFPSSFTPAQLREIRKVSQAKIMCENADEMPTAQVWAMQLPHPIHNPRVNCRDLPTINLEYWREDPMYGRFQYMRATLLERTTWTVLLCSFLFCGLNTSSYDDYEYENDCALKLKRSPSVSSANVPLDNTDYYPQPTEVSGCIRYKDVNDALAEAKKIVRYPLALKQNAINSDNDLDAISRLIIETARILASRFQLSAEEIYEGLPLIDTYKTDIWDVCPKQFKPVTCAASRFRPIDGQCTTLENSVLGMAGTPFKRLLPPVYANGIDAPRVSPVDGKPLPHVRIVSTIAHPDISDLRNQVTILLSSWAQFLAHDFLLQQFARDENGVVLQCCEQKTHPNCMPIFLSKKDPFYRRVGRTCLEFQRTITGLRPGCALGTRSPGNLVSARVDAGFLYGNSKFLARRLRVGKNGLLKTWPKYRDLGLKDLLPPLTEFPDFDCIRGMSGKFCFLTGDLRVFTQPQTSALQTLYVRYHNRLAEELAYFNSHWDDERVYQEARSIVTANLMHTAFNELLPALIGPEYVQAFNLTLQKQGYWQGFDKNAVPGTFIELQSAAFRFGHTHFDSKVNLYNKYHTFVDSLENRNTQRQPFELWEPGVIDMVLLGALNSPIQNGDRYMVKDLTNHLFQMPNVSYGGDLAAFNTMRGRDHAFRGYNDYRELCGLPRAKTFEDLEYFLMNGTAQKYAKIYKHPDEIELWSAGISERHVKGGVVGPTFACIIGYQMNLIRRSDRFWYENPGFPSSFTPGQLEEIRKITIAKTLCDTTDDVPTLQMWVMYMADPKYNPRVACKDLPDINLEYWIEDPKTEAFKYEFTKK